MIYDVRQTTTYVYESARREEALLTPGMRGECIRIISARRATPHEQDRYRKSAR
jgi:uncharacterized DUF497 family protein